MPMSSDCLVLLNNRMTAAVIYALDKGIPLTNGEVDEGVGP